MWHGVFSLRGLEFAEDAFLRTAATVVLDKTRGRQVFIRDDDFEFITVLLRRSATAF